MSPSEVLEAAKWKILENGWLQMTGEVAPLGSERCAGLAISDCEGDHLMAYDYFYRAIGMDGDTTIRAGLGPLYQWNDDPNRTLHEVLDAFDHAIKLAKEDEALSHAPSTTYKNKEVKV